MRVKKVHCFSVPFSDFYHRHWPSYHKNEYITPRFPLFLFCRSIPPTVKENPMPNKMFLIEIHTAIPAFRLESNHRNRLLDLTFFLMDGRWRVCVRPLRPPVSIINKGGGKSQKKNKSVPSRTEAVAQKVNYLEPLHRLDRRSRMSCTVDVRKGVSIKQHTHTTAGLSS